MNILYSFKVSNSSKKQELFQLNERTFELENHFFFTPQI